MIGRHLVAMAIALGAVALARGVAANESIPHGEGVYWRIDRPGAPLSYILGTIHFGAPREINLGSEVARRIGLSRVVFLELRLDQTRPRACDTRCSCRPASHCRRRSVTTRSR